MISPITCTSKIIKSAPCCPYPTHPFHLKVYHIINKEPEADSV
jgi:hypothetical protein